MKKIIQDYTLNFIEFNFSNVIVNPESVHGFINTLFEMGISVKGITSSSCIVYMKNLNPSLSQHYKFKSNSDKSITIEKLKI